MKPEQKLRELMKQYGWSAAELARRAGFRHQVIDRLLEGQPKVVARALAIARALKVSPDWLWSDAPWPPPMPLSREVEGQKEALRVLAIHLAQSVGLEIRDPSETPPGKGKARKGLRLRKE